MQTVQKVIDACGRGSQRIRDLPAPVMVYFIIALNLFPGVAYTSVLRWLLCGLQWLGNRKFHVACREAISNARQRLGELPLKVLHQEVCKPMADRTLKGSYFKNWHLVALDGSTLALQDTAVNEKAFGRSSNQNGEGAWPIARFVALVECGTHLIFGAALGSYRDSEIRLAKPLSVRLCPGMLCLADRLFPSFQLWRRFAATGADLLWRAKISMPLKIIKVLPDGSYLAEWLPKMQRRQGNRANIVRVIEYRLGDSGTSENKGETYRLITTILDPEKASAEELAKLYPQRWEIELTVKEGKAILRKGKITLRSKIPELVRQEFWGMILAHYLVRKTMSQAVLDSGQDPDDLSYDGCIEIIKATQSGSVLNFSP